MVHKLDPATLMVGAALAIAAVAPAQAATISYSQNYGPISLIGPPQYVIPPLSFAQFDPTMGVLQGVTIDVGLIDNVTLTYENLGPAAETVTLQAVSSATFSGAGVTPFAASTTYAVTRSLTGFDGNFDNAGTSGFSANNAFNTQAQYVVNPLDFANFIGTGTYTGMLKGHLDVTLQGEQNSDHDGGASSQGNGVVTVTYTFAPLAAAPVPEPATWAMLMAGFGLVGGGMRRWRSMRVGMV